MSEVRVAVSLDAEALLSGFGAYVGLPDLTFGERGFVGLLFDDHALNIFYDGARDAFMLYGPVGQVPPSVDDGFFRRLAVSAHSSAFGGEGALTFDEVHGQVIWSDRIPLSGLTQERFQEALKAAVDRIEWLKRSPFDVLLRGEGTSGSPVSDFSKSEGAMRI
ncbi:hypothetical protein FHS82_001974 [Pseudochelatococcus lubricantis]|uniref:Type III secretion system chaperone n=1 Tax=Pseudochelatococcus lubricantis TaxID=1538102 RepID=A0ABX0UYX4_9HYPH|nr:type III secretion system chaperone [Pseudochelatococcus lubricantis]NIJ58132.1 hypothetical protein [Pseudochelatococcus lubricantis]